MEIHQWPLCSLHKKPAMWKAFPCHDSIMCNLCPVVHRWDMPVGLLKNLCDLRSDAHNYSLRKNINIPVYMDKIYHENIVKGMACLCWFIDRLTHWGRVTHICVSDLTIIGSDNGLSPGRRQAIIWTNVWILLIGPLGTNFSEILIEILVFSS